jgi:hypothetical protein
MKQPDLPQALKGFLTCLALATAVRGAEAPSAPVIRELRPLSVRGVNCFPSERPWGGLWTKTLADVWEGDMALAASPRCITSWPLKAP